MMKDDILKTIARIITPFIQLYGIFIILNGHISPGGGFAGGTMIGTSLILYTFVFGVRQAKGKFSEKASALAESGGIIMYILIGVIGIVVAGHFLANKGAGFDMGTPGSLWSAGMIPLLMIAIGIKVASTFITIFHTLIEVKDA